MSILAHFWRFCPIFGPKNRNNSPHRSRVFCSGRGKVNGHKRVFVKNDLLQGCRLTCWIQQGSWSTHEDGHFFKKWPKTFALDDPMFVLNLGSTSVIFEIFWENRVLVEFPAEYQVWGQRRSFLKSLWSGEMLLIIYLNNFRKFEVMPSTNSCKHIKIRTMF